MQMYVYAGCLALGIFFTLISMVAGHFFGGHDGADVGTGGHVEAGLDTHGMPGMSFFSPTVLATFVTAFGAFGIVFCHIQATNTVWASAPLAGISGGVVAWLIFLLFNTMFKRTQSSSESRVASLAGQTASIITPIPPNGVGEIAYVQGGTRYTAPARAEQGIEIGAGSTVRIRRIVGTQFYVETLSAFDLK
ncbi:MAG TPA: NfeD family protein [Verrucomicrobiae bacterium]|nr:NfeD family protein [Verrucomicrobiae bacterium]